MKCTIRRTKKPFFGEAGIDRLYADGTKDMAVSLNIVDENGEAHHLCRTRRNDRMTITYDGHELRQSDLTEMFGEKDIFLSIFNPLYFIEELGDDGRKLLERYLPGIPHETVLSMLSKNVQDALKNEEILSPEGQLFSESSALTSRRMMRKPSGWQNRISRTQPRMRIRVEKPK